MQTWTLRADGRDHRVTADTRMSRTVTWWVDGEQVAQRKGADDRLRLESDAHGALEVRHSALGAPRRATWQPPGAGITAHAGVGGVDLEPEPGSRAAASEQRLRDHPRRHAVLETLGGVGKVVVPLVVAALLARFAFSFDWPFSLPDWDLPDLPLPDLPSIPWPDWDLPAWVGEVIDVLKLLVPVVLSFVLARAEIRRRRHQDQLRRDRDHETDQ